MRYITEKWLDLTKRVPVMDSMNTGSKPTVSSKTTPKPLQNENATRTGTDPVLWGKVFDGLMGHYLYDKALNKFDSSFTSGSAKGASHVLNVADKFSKEASLSRSSRTELLKRARDKYIEASTIGSGDAISKFNQKYANGMKLATLAAIDTSDTSVVPRIKQYLTGLGYPFKLKTPDFETKRNLFQVDTDFPISKDEMLVARENAMSRFTPETYGEASRGYGDRDVFARTPEHEAEVYITGYDNSEGALKHANLTFNDGASVRGNAVDSSSNYHGRVEIEPAKLYLPKIADSLIKFLPASEQNNERSKFFEQHSATAIKQAVNSMNKKYSNHIFQYSDNQIRAIRERLNK